MERMPPNPESTLEITKEVIDGLELIRQSGLTNMLDRRSVLSSAKAWNLNETVEWIEAADPKTYGRLVVYGFDSSDQYSPSESSSKDPAEIVSENHFVDQGFEPVYWYDVMAHLKKQASRTISDTFDKEEKLMSQPSAKSHLAGERVALMVSLAEATSLGQQLEETMSSIRNNIKSIQLLLDEENS